MTARTIPSIDHVQPVSHAPELAPVTARGIARMIAAIGIVLTISLSITDALELAPYGAPHGDLRAALLAVSLAIPLHVRHLFYGVRGERPPAGAWTLAALAIVTAAGALFAGDAWAREFSPLAVSVLIVVPGRRGLMLFCAIALAPLFLVGTQWYATVEHPLPGAYFTFLIVWRTSTQFVLLRLLTALRALDASGDELEARAVVQSRVRIDTELRKGVGAVLERIIARGEVAVAAAATDAARAVTELRRLASDSRRGLYDARRIAAGYRESSVRAELESVAALLEASGALVRIVVADGISLESPDVRARHVIRSALAEALRGEPVAGYRLRVARDGAGSLTVSIEANDARGET